MTTPQFLAQPQGEEPPPLSTPGIADLGSRDPKSAKSTALQFQETFME